MLSSLSGQHETTWNKLSEAACCSHSQVMRHCLHAQTTDKGVKADKGDEKKEIKVPELQLTLN